MLMLSEINEPGAGFTGEKPAFLRIKWPRQETNSREMISLGKNGQIRIYSMVNLNNEWLPDEEMVVMNNAIDRGESVHEIFTRNGYSVRKNVLDIYMMSMTPSMAHKFGTNQVFAKAQNAEYIVRKGETIYCYAIAQQIYSPEYWSAELNEIDRQRINFSFYTLLASGFSRTDIWQLMDDSAQSWWKISQQ